MYPCHRGITNICDDKKKTSQTNGIKKTEEKKETAMLLSSLQLFTPKFFTLVAVEFVHLLPYVSRKQ